MLAGRALSMTNALLHETRVGEFRIHGKDEPVILVGNNKMGVYEALEAIGFSGDAIDDGVLPWPSSPSPSTTPPPAPTVGAGSDGRPSMGVELHTVYDNRDQRVSSVNEMAVKHDSTVSHEPLTTDAGQIIYPIRTPFAIACVLR